MGSLSDLVSGLMGGGSGMAVSNKNKASSNMGNNQADQVPAYVGGDPSQPTKSLPGTYNGLPPSAGDPSASSGSPVQYTSDGTGPTPPAATPGQVKITPYDAIYGSPQSIASAKANPVSYSVADVPPPPSQPTPDQMKQMTPEQQDMMGWVPRTDQQQAANKPRTFNQPIAPKDIMGAIQDMNNPLYMNQTAYDRYSQKGFSPNYKPPVAGNTDHPLWTEGGGPVSDRGDTALTSKNPNLPEAEDRGWDNPALKDIQDRQKGVGLAAPSDMTLQDMGAVKQGNEIYGDIPGRHLTPLHPQAQQISDKQRVQDMTNAMHNHKMRNMLQQMKKSLDERMKKKKKGYNA